MGKNRRFTGFFVFLSCVLFSLNLWADAYTCPTYTTYTSCAAGYYMATPAPSAVYNGTPEEGNACFKCPSGASCPGGTYAPRYAVTLDGNGGNVGSVTTFYRAADLSGGKFWKSTTGADTVSFTNALPTNPGYYFNGYYTAKSGGIQIVKADGSYNPTNYSSFAKTASATTLYAQWTQCPEGSYCDGVVATLCPDGGHSEAGADAITDCFMTITYMDTALNNPQKTQNCYYNRTEYSCDLYGLADLEWEQQFNGKYYAMLGWSYTDNSSTNDFSLGSKGAKFSADTTFYMRWAACSLPTTTNATVKVYGVKNNVCQYDYECNVGYYNSNHPYRGAFTSFYCGSCTNAESIVNAYYTSASNTNSCSWDCLGCRSGESGANCTVNKGTNSCEYTASCDDVSLVAYMNGRVPVCAACPANSSKTSGANSCTCSSGYSLGDGYTHSDVTISSGSVATSDGCVANKYTVTYNCGEGNGTPPNEATATYNATFTPSTNPDQCVKENYEFIGWKIADKDVKDPFRWTYTSNQTLVAQWRQRNVTCQSGKMEDGSACPVGSYCPAATVEMTSSEDCAIACPRADELGAEKRDDTVISVTSPSGASQRTQCVATYTPINLLDNGNVIGTATKQCNYSSNKDSYLGGNCTVTPVSCEAGYYRNAVNSPTCSPVSAGYYSCDNLDACSCKDLAGDNVLAAESATSTAKSKTATDCYYLCKSTPTVDGSDGTGTITYYPEQVYYSGTEYPACTKSKITCDDSVHFTGKLDTETCDANGYVITYVLNGGTNNSANPSSYTYISDTINLADATRANSAFDGWYKNEYFTGGKVTQIASGSDENITLYAKWSCNDGYVKAADEQSCNPKTSTISLQQDGATVAGAGTLYTKYGAGSYVDASRDNLMTGSENAISTLPQQKFVVTYRAGADNVTLNKTSEDVVSTFDGYYSAKTNGTQYVDANGFVTDAGSEFAKKLYDETGVWFAQWTPKSIDLPVAPTRTGYQFAGWNNGATTLVAGAEYTVSSDVVFTAMWTPNKYIIEFVKDNESATGSMSSQECEYDTTCTLNENQFKLTNYGFAGWEDSAGKIYLDKAGVLNLTSENGGTVTLTATWSQYFHTCLAGFSSDNVTPCADGFYCPGGTVDIANKDSETAGCQIRCPAGGTAASIASNTKASALTDCYASYSDAAVDHGRAEKSNCYYDLNRRDYSYGCEITVKYCDPGYYRAQEDPTTCSIVDKGFYSCGDNNLDACSCEKLAGAIGGGKTLTESTGSSVATQCYNVCDNKDTANGELVATGNQFFDGEKYPDCEYTTVCDANYHPNGSECLPNVYSVILDPESGDGLKTIYVKYNDGWYSDAETTKPITSLELPTKTGSVCNGYSANNQDIIDADGMFVPGSEIAITENNTYADANWKDKASITCNAGTYFNAETTECEECVAGYYCPNRITVYEGQATDVGMEQCNSDASTYTAATTADGTQLTVAISSEPGATSETQCYATNLAYTSPTNNATGAQTCYYNATLSKYNADCSVTDILTCNAGYYYDAGKSTTDCTKTSSGYYSADKELVAQKCPFLGTDGNNIASMEGATKIEDCYLKGAWTEPEGSHSGQRGDCFWNVDSENSIKAYNTNCETTIIVTCDAGYYDAKGYVENDPSKSCSLVSKPYYSPDQSAFCAAGNTDCLKPSSVGESTGRYECPNGGETLQDGAKSVADCYLSVACNTDNGGTGAYNCSYNTQDGQYNICDEPCDVSSCPTGYDLIDGVCQPQTYSCEAGKYFDGTTMVECPENSYCDGTGTATFGVAGCAAVACPSDYPLSVAGAKSEGECYKTKTGCSCIENKKRCEEYGAVKCNLKSKKIDGVEYLANPGSCVPAPDVDEEYAYCEFLSVRCESNTTRAQGYYFAGDLETGRCELCNFSENYNGQVVDQIYSINSFTFPGPTSIYGESACFGVVNLPCTVPVCPGEGGASCVYDKTSYKSGAGYLFNDGTGVPVPGANQTNYLCPLAEGSDQEPTWTCKAGYDHNDAANNNPLEADVSEPWELCLPHMSTITLNPNYAGAENQSVYQTYNRGWFNEMSKAESAVMTESASQVTGTIATVTPPTRVGYTFDGYYTKQYAVEAGYARVIPVNGTLPANTSFTADTELYAQWVNNVYTVTLNHNGGAGDVETVYEKYDIGWFTDAAATTDKKIEKVAIPTKTNSMFKGYFADGQSNAVIAADGILPANNVFDKDVTLTAQWLDCPAAEFGAYVETAELVGVVDNKCQYVHTCEVGHWNTNNDVAVFDVAIDCAECTADKPDSADWDEDLFTADACTWTCKPCVAGNGVASCDVTQTATTCDYSVVCKDNHIKTSGVNSYLATCAACPMNSTADNGQDGCYCDEHYGVGTRVEIGGVCPADIYEITLNSGYDAADSVIYQRWMDAFYSDEVASQKITAVQELSRGSAYRFDGYFTVADDSLQEDAPEVGTRVIDAYGQIISGVDVPSNTTWYAHWTGLTYDCEAGYYYAANEDGSDSMKETCYAPYYCDGTGVVTVGQTGCISTCPADGWLGDKNDDGTYTYQDNKPIDTIASCHKLTTDSAFGNGTADSDCYYTNGDLYATDCSVVPLTCDAGYYYPSGSGARACSDAGNGYYSPKDALNRTACPLFEELGDGKIGSANGREEINDCYIVCDLKTADVAHSVTLAPNNDHEYYNDNQYNACSYTVSKCEDGYTPVSGTEPACNANTYSVKLYKFAGSDEVVDTVQCTFDSQNCVLPSTDQLVRAGYVSVAKWCDADGKCFDAGKNTTQNISANGTDIALYAQWESDVFAVQLVADDADVNATQNPIYLKYNIGWYSDAEATQPFGGLTDLPEKDNGAYLFAGYKIGEKQIIGADGKTLDGTNTVVTDDATATVVWSKGITVCAPGYYYLGNGNADNCLPCETNYYCEGGNFGTDSGVVGGLIACPDNGVSDGGVNATSSAACYKTKLNYVAQYGVGTQTCFYKDGAYADRCKDIEITSCAGGYFYDEGETSVDCVEVGVDYYSVEGDMTKTQCPSNALITGITGDVTTAATVYECFATVAAKYAHGSGEKVCDYTSGTDNELIYNTDCRDYYINYCDAGYYREADVVSDTVPDCVAVGMGNYSTVGDVDMYACPPDAATGESGKTETEISGSVAACYVNNTPYPADDYDKTPLHGGGYQTCFYTAETGKYDTNCGTPTFTYCDAGYYNDGIYVNGDGARDCTAVEDGYYSADEQLERKKCPDNGKTGKVDAADITECYLTDVACDILNGTGSQDICYYGDAEYSDCSECYVTSCDETYSQVGNMCVNCAENHFCTDGQQFSCSDETNGEFPLSVPGSTKVEDCYRTCDMADNATEMDGMVYSDGVNTCAVVSCDAGYTLQDGACEVCPEDSICDGNGGGAGNDVKTCAEITGGTHTESEANMSDSGYCYRACDKAPNATEMDGYDYFKDEYDTCAIVTCDAGYTLKDGVCEVCPAGSICDGNGGGAGNDVKTCAEITGGTHTESEANMSDSGYCYRACDMADNATEMSGTDYFNDEYDTCAVVTCDAGYTLQNGVCEVCPEDSICDGNGGGEGNDVKTCSDLTGGTHTESEANVSDSGYCYRACDKAPNATEMSGTDYFNDEYDTCAIVTCDAGYTLQDGACVGCPAGSICDGNGGGEGNDVKTCAEITGGTHTESEANMSDSGYCYRACDKAPNATEMDGYDYFNDEYDTCAIVTCDAGYMLQDGACVVCPAGSICDGNGGGEGNDVKTCSDLTGGTHTMSDANVSDEGLCYRTCDMANNATKMTGRDYYTATDTCAVVTCDAGYRLQDGACVACPAGSICDGNGGGEGNDIKTCSDLTGGTHTMSDANMSDKAYCYRTCDIAANATEMTGRDYYTATDTCAIVTCDAGYRLQDGACVACPAGSICDGNGGGAGNDVATCAALTNGTHTMSDANMSDKAYCYRTCDIVANATEMTGRDYYTATDTCAVVTCEAGYRLQDGACVACPAGSICDGNGGGAGNDVVTCESLTNGEYPNSDAGSTSIGECYKECASDESATMEGRDYYDDAKDTCTIAKCNAGYTPAGSECALCPADSFCDGTVEGTKTCAEMTGGEHPYSISGADSINDCYAMCEAYDVKGGTALPVNDTEFYPTQCEFYGISDTGNPCDIDTGVCVETSCNYNYEMIDGKCEPCNRENAVTYKEGGNCVVESCVIGYHPYGQGCEADVKTCSAPNAVSAEQTWNTRLGAFGACMITECEDGYHLAENVCQLDEQVCELAHGIGVREWNHKTNTWGKCVATKCDPGYTNDPSMTNQLWQECGECANKYAAGGELAASSYVQECEIASCMYQGELYNLENNECVQVCTTYSDETGSRRWNPSTKKCEHDCADGYVMW